MLYPYSPLDFVEAIERQRRESIHADANRVGILHRLALRLAAVRRSLRTRPTRTMPKPA